MTPQPRPKAYESRVPTHADGVPAVGGRIDGRWGPRVAELHETTGRMVHGPCGSRLSLRFFTIRTIVAGSRMKTAKSLALALVFTACTPAVTDSPPQTPGDAALKGDRTPHFGPAFARRDSSAETLHNTVVKDHYQWLENPEDPATQAWTAQYDQLTRAYLSEMPGRAALQARLEQLSYVDTVGTPVREGDRLFFERRRADQEKSVWYSQRDGEEARVLLDPNTMSDDGSVSLKGIFPTHDGKRIAYRVSENNADHATLYVMDVSTGEVSKTDVIHGARYAYPSWNADGTGFYYAWLPTDESIPVSELPGYAEIRYHRLGTDPEKDPVVFEKTGNPQYFLYARVSRDGRYLIVEKDHGWNSTDVYIKDLKTQGEFKPVAEGLDARFKVWAWNGKLYLLTNFEAPRWRLLSADPGRLDQKHWTEVIPEQPTAVLEDAEIVGGKLSLRYLEKASSRLRLADLDGTNVQEIQLPNLGTVERLAGHPEHDDAYFLYSSFTQPETVYRASAKTGSITPYFETSVPVDSRPYQVNQVWYPSKDGTQISMFLIHQKGLPMNGDAPFMLYGYGGFNISLTPEFSPAVFAWLEAGGGVAIPNLRGGGEYGEDWHRAGMLSQKQNVFDDFTAAAEYLVAEGYTSPSKLAIRGGSNGGLLVGAAMTQRPELFRVVSCRVPLLDMVRYHKFGSGKTWISEYGSADDAEQFRVLHAYSPYHRLENGTEYPSLIMLSADSDDRVDPMHARKFVASAQYASASEHPVLLRVETNSGHGGGDMVQKRVERLTDEYSFLFHELQMGAFPPPESGSKGPAKPGSN